VQKLSKGIINKLTFNESSRLTFNKKPKKFCVNSYNYNTILAVFVSVTRL